MTPSSKLHSDLLQGKHPQLNFPRMYLLSHQNSLAVLLSSLKFLLFVLNTL